MFRGQNGRGCGCRCGKGADAPVRSSGVSGAPGVWMQVRVPPERGNRRMGEGKEFGVVAKGGTTNNSPGNGKIACHSVDSLAPSHPAPALLVHPMACWSKIPAEGQQQPQRFCVQSRHSCRVQHPCVQSGSQRPLCCCSTFLRKPNTLVSIPNPTVAS